MNRVLLLIISFLISGKSFAQPSVLGTDLVNGSYSKYDITDLGVFRQYRLQAGSSAAISTRKWEFAQGTAASTDYTTNWRPYTSNNTMSVNTYIPASFANGAKWNTGSGGASGLLPVITSGNYYTFNVSENSAADNIMQLLETSFNPVTISAVSQSPAGSFVNSTLPVAITATISASLSSGENLFVRYSLNSNVFTSSSIVSMTGSGTTYTANIPAQAAGNTVYYYIFSSNKTSAQLATDFSTYGETVYDMATLNLKTLIQSGSGNTNYSYTTTSNPVIVNSAGGTASASYATLKAAFDAINAGTHTSVITTLIEGNTTETVSASLNASGSGAASYTSISVQPNGGAFTVSGSIIGNGIITFNGADNVTVNGLNTGGNSLTISNTSTSAGGNTSAVRFTNDAENNTVQNCTITGSSTSSSGGVIVFGDGSIFGNNNNTISNNTITAAGSNLPLNAIYSNEGVSAGNNTNTISNNNISDFFSATTSSTGIYLNAANDGWTISGNKIFQSATRTSTAASITHRAIYIVSGGGYTISGNTIGYANSSGTGTSTYTASNAAVYVGINLSIGSVTSSSVTGNTIAGISFTTTASSTGGSGIFTGIYMTTGLATITNNTIGVISTGAITVSSTSNSTGIKVTGMSFNIATNAITISGNTITAMSASGSSTSGYALYPIEVSGTGSFTISSNTIGDASTANSVSAGVSATTTATCSIRGIFAIATGGMTITGNTIQNCSAFGTGSSFFTGINTTSLASGTLSITNNNILNNKTEGSSGLQGISNSSAPATLTVTGNVIRGFSLSNSSCPVDGIKNSGAVTSAITISSNQLGNASGGYITYSVANSGALTGITNTSGSSTTTLTIQSNDIRGITHSIAGSSSHTYISNSFATLSQDVSSNTFTNLSVNTSGSVTFISNSVALTASGTKTINSNSISGTFAKPGGGGNLYFYFDAGGSVSGATINNSSNNFSNITMTGGTVVQGWFNTDGTTGVTKNIQNNTFSSISAGSSGIFPLQVTNGSGNISGNTISSCSAPNTVTAMSVSSGSFSIFSNTITTLSSSTSFAGVTGISISGGATHSIYSNVINSLSTTATSSTVAAITVSSGTTINIYKNKIYDLSTSTTSSIYGISLSSTPTTVTAYNNYIGDLRATAATSNDAIRGISAAMSSGTANIYYNTIYLSTSSSGSGFGSSCMYANTGPTVNLRNNVFVNLSTATGSGLTIAYRRNGTTLSTYSSTSNNNLFYAGTPGSANVIYYDGSTSDRTLAEFQGRLSNGGGTRDIYSVTENPNFLSTTGSSSNFLKINTTIATYIESRGVNISGITDDYDGDIRQGNVGYVGTGTAPDIGADEFAGTSIACGTITVTSTGGTGAPSSCYLTLAAAVSAINGGTIHTGTITCSVPAGFTETAPSGGYQLTASGSSGSPITYIKSGAGANPAITASASLTTGQLYDGIFKLIGADYTTIDGFTMQENSSNTTTTAASNNMTEWGVALLYTTTTNGSQNNTIQNCNISLNKSYSNTFGIYSNTRHSAAAVTTTAEVSSTAGANSSNKIYSNSISNVNYPVCFVGASTAANMDVSNDIGGSSSSTANTITNWGSSTVLQSAYVSVSGTIWGIYMNHQTSYNVSYNTLTSSTGISTTTFNGIRTDFSNGTPSGTFTNTISNNTITLDGAASTAMRCIDAGSGVSTMTLTISGNTLLNNNITGSTTNFTGIINSGGINTVNITSNVLRGTTSAVTSGTFTAISNTGAVTTAININSNQLGNSSGNAVTFSNASSGAGTCISNTNGLSTCALSIQGNNFQGIVHSTAASSSHTYISNTFATLSQNISSNTFTNLTLNTTGSITFISNSVSLSASGSKTISSNSVITAFSKTGAGGTVTFYNDAASSTAGGTNINSNNNFSNITITGATIMQGWLNSETNTTKTIQNNTFNNITGIGSSCEMLTVSGSGSAAVSGNTITNITGSGSVLRGIVSSSGTQTFSSNTINNLSSSGGNTQGIAITGGTAQNVLQNTINTLSSSAASFTATGILVSGGTTVNVYKNKIYDISESNATVNTTNGATNGIAVTAGTTVSVYNNLIGDLKAATANSNTIDAVRGVNINSTTTSSTINLYYNTIYVSASSSGTNFSTSGVYHTTSSTSTTAALDMRNNIIVNLSTPNGSGNTVAYRRSSTTLTNYSSNSNNNLFYAGTPSSTQLIFSDGTNTDQNMSTYITRVSTRDLSSVTENPAFISTTGSSSSFLHINTSTPTVIEGGAVTISSYTDDYDGDTRNASTPDIGADEFTYTGISTAAYYFRTKSTGSNWNNASYWEYSPDGSTWSNATSYPTSAATKINVLSGHTIIVATAATANALQVDAGGTLSHTNGISLTIANGSGNDGSGTDFIVNGTYVINGTQPTFNSGATAEIKSGGLVRADANTSGSSDDFAWGTNATFKTGSVFQWNNTLAFETTSKTYFPNSGTSDIPIFRITSNTVTVGSNTFTTINGKFEINSGFSQTWTSAGTKTFRDGIGGTGGTLVHDNTCGTFAITGTSAVIDGSVIININNTASITTDMQIASGASCTVSGSPTISAGTAANTGALLVVDGTLAHNGGNAIDFKTGSGDFTVNGSYSGTGTLTLSSTATDITVGGSSGGSAGTFKFTPGSANNTASTVTISRSGANADMTLGSDFGVTNAVSNSSATFTIGANTLTMNGTVTGSGTFTGSSSSNMIIGGTTGGSFGTLLFKPGAQTLNNFTMGRTGASSSVTLGTSNNLTVGNVFDITNAAATVVIGSNTVTMNGTLTGSGSFTGSSLSGITVGGTSGGSLGTMRFAAGAQTLNTLTISRTGSGANAVLGSDLSVSNLLNIVNSAASFSIGANTLTLAGTVTGSGFLSGTTSSNLTMSGSGQVGTLRFASGGQLLNTLSLNRTSVSNDYAALLGSALTVNALTLTNGILATGDNLLTWTNTGSLLPAAQTSYTANSTSYQNSYICICDGTGTALSFTEPFDGSKGFRINSVGTNVWFPVGVDFAAPNRMWINNTGTSDNITVLIKKGDLNNTGYPVVQRIWYVNETTPGGTTADMQLFFTKQNNTQFGISQDEVENGFDYTAAKLAQRDYGDNNYLDISQGTDIQNILSNTNGTEVYGNYSIGVSPDVSANTDGINYFSRFMVLNENAFILPVTITNFKAWQDGVKAKLSWISNNETNIEAYVIERSADNRSYTAIGNVKAMGSVALSIPYNFTDVLPLSGKNYYRIKVIEKDGKHFYTNIQTLDFIRNFVVRTYPNPVTDGRLTVQLNNDKAGQFILNLYSADGKIVFTDYINHAGGFAAYNISLPASLAKGVYVLKIKGRDNAVYDVKNIIAGNE